MFILIKNIWLWNHYATDMYANKGGRHYWFAQNLIKKGYKVTIFCANTFHNKHKSINTGKKKYVSHKCNNIPFVFVKTTVALGNGINRIKNMLLFYFNLFTVTKQYLKNNKKPDIIIASSVHPLTMVAGIKVSKKLNIPCICEVRDLWPEAIFSYNKVKKNSLFGKLLIIGEHWIYKKANAIIFTKKGDIDYIIENKWDIKNGGNIDLNKIYYINNGVDVDQYNKQINDKIINDRDLQSEKFNIIYVGSLRPVNNVGNILDTANYLQKDKSIQFLIYGDGNEKEILEQRIINENISNVKIKGYINKQYIPYVLSNSSINILNYSDTKYNWSRGNSSNKLFEYMASGKPIISTIKTGYSIINKYQCGVEINNNTPENLAKQILYIKNMPKNEYNKLCYNAKKAIYDFDFKILTDKLIDVINNLC